MKVTKKYDEILEITHGDVLASPGFFISVGASDWGYIVEDGRVLPYYIKKKLFFKYMIFPSGIYGATDENWECKFLNNLIVFVKQSFKVDFILSQHVTSLFKAVPHNALFCKFGSYVLNLSLSNDDLWAKLHSKHRNVIRKAEKDGVLVTCGNENKNICIELVQDTLSRQGLPLINSKYFNNLDRIDKVDYWLASFEGKADGAAIVYWHSNCKAYYIYGGSVQRTHGGSMNLLQWKVIETLKERGVKYYDFVGARLNPPSGSKYEGIQRFKERFGGDLLIGYLWKYPLNKMKYNLYQSLVFIKSKGRYKGDIIDQERKRGMF